MAKLTFEERQLLLMLHVKTREEARKEISAMRAEDEFEREFLSGLREKLSGSPMNFEKEMLGLPVEEGEEYDG